MSLEYCIQVFQRHQWIKIEIQQPLCVDVIVHFTVIALWEFSELLVERRRKKSLLIFSVGNEHWPKRNHVANTVPFCKVTVDTPWKFRHIHIERERTLKATCTKLKTNEKDIELQAISLKFESSLCQVHSWVCVCAGAFFVVNEKVFEFYFSRSLQKI